MLSVLLLLIGGAISFYCLWQLRRWMAASEAATAAVPDRLGAIAEELVVTAEATSAALAEKAEELVDLIAQADQRLIRLREGSRLAEEEAPAIHTQAGVVSLASKRVAARGGEPNKASASEPAVVGALSEVHREVYTLADEGHDVTAIARRFSMTKGEVQFILGLRRMT